MPPSTTVKSRLRELWERPCGVREVLAIGLPLVISMISWTIMNFVDRMFLYWSSQEAMAAALPTGMILFAMLCFPLGIAGFANTFVAQYEGADRRHEIGRVVWQALCVGLFFTPFFLASIPAADWFFSLTGHDPRVQAYEVEYYRSLALGAGGMVCSGGLATFFSGRGNTRVIMYVDAFASVLNIVLDYVLIFGEFGFPKLGVAGAGLATSISQWSKAVIYWYLISRPQYETEYRIRAGRRWDPEMMSRLFRYGGPEGLRLFIDVAAITGFVFIVGRLGQDALAATTLAFNVNSVAFVPLLGIGTAVSTMVGQQLGRDRVDLARRATKTSFLIALVYSAMMGIVYVGIPDLLMMGHAAGADPEEFAQLRRVTVLLLRFVAVYCLLDACQIVFVSAIKGAGDTRFVLLTTILVCPLPVLIAGYGVVRLDWGLFACWTVLTVWIWTLGIVYGLRYWHGAWENMRVIKPTVAESVSSAA